MLMVMTTCRAGELLFYLGQIRKSQGRFKEGSQYHQRALVQFRASLGEDDFYTGLAYYQYAVHTLREKGISATK